MPETLPFELAQVVEFELRVDGSGGDNAVAWIIRGQDQRPLLAGYWGSQLLDEPNEAVTVGAPAFFDPLKISSIEGSCPAICVPPPSLGVPNECNCTRQLSLEFRLSPMFDSALILDRSAGAVPGEPSGHASVLGALAWEDCFDAPRRRYEFVFIGGQAP